MPDNSLAIQTLSLLEPANHSCDKVHPETSAWQFPAGSVTSTTWEQLFKIAAVFSLSMRSAPLAVKSFRFQPVEPRLLSRAKSFTNLHNSPPAFGDKEIPVRFSQESDSPDDVSLKHPALNINCQPGEACENTVELPELPDTALQDENVPDHATLTTSPITPSHLEIPAQDSLGVSQPPRHLPPSGQYTRLRPPTDLVKLEDRLFYLLQPSLETLITEGDLHFPHHPFPYQFQGVAFLYPRVAAVLADEMGLGKTMQAITSVRLLIHAGELRRVLLVCPKPLVSNWVREFQLWAPELPVAVIEGDQAKREWQWSQVDAPIKIANYEALQRDKDLATAPEQQYDLVMLDESQRIKNRGGATAQVVKALHRRRSWALTGTPVENSPDDLLGIFDFVAPGQLHKGMKPKTLGKAAGEYILRRTKAQVLTELPPKLFRDADVELSAAQAETYRLAEEEGVLRLNNMHEPATIQHVFELVLRLKQICNFDPVTGQSSKLERLEADLEEIAASGKKAILFSQWVETLAKLRGHLNRFGLLEYHGQIPHKQREQVIENFRNDPDKHLLLMSYGAGSVGLNLQFCEYVFLFDRWWNPAIEDQAINRAHRIGAAGPVTVTRFLTLGTVEERINQVLEEKRELFDTILSGAETHRALGLSAGEIFGLFQLRCPTGEVRYAA
ncbi:MAG: DEAD/DEAH box helicase [Pirellulales bacterium]|nr:DEAD/DEAH box helicase [Pirellulales bacterium]